MILLLSTFQIRALMLLKDFAPGRVENANLHEKGCLKKSLFSEKIIAVLSFCKMKSVQAHEIGWLALQKKKIEKISVDYACYWYERRFLLI